MKDYFKLFSRIAAGLMQRQAPEVLTQKLIDEAVSLIGADFGYIHLVNEDQQSMRIIAVANTDLSPVSNLRITKGDGVAGVCWQDEQTTIVHDYANWERRAKSQAVSHMKSAIATPMIKDGVVIGVLGLGCVTPQRFNSEHIAPLSHFADIGVVALDNASLIDQISTELDRSAALTSEISVSAQRYRELFQDTERRLLRSQALVHISGLLNSNSSLDELIAMIQEATLSALDVEDLRIYKLRKTSGAGYQIDAEESDASTPIDISLASLNRVVANLVTRENDLQPDQPSEVVPASAHTVTLEQRAGLICVIRNEHTPWGCLVATLREDSAFENEDKEVLQAIANQFSLAVRQRSLLEYTAHQANHDELTGLPNRRFFKHTVQQLLAQSPDDSHKLSMLVFDLDGFKSVNDTHGHQYGDMLLCAISDRLKQSAPSDVVIARLGGDEFAVLIVGASSAEIDCDIADLLLTRIQQPVEIAGQRLVVNASVGISRFPAHGTAYSELMVAADAAMYSVKKAGAGGFRIYTTKRPRSKHEPESEQADIISRTA